MDDRDGGRVVDPDDAADDRLPHQRLAGRLDPRRGAVAAPVNGTRDDRPQLRRRVHELEHLVVAAARGDPGDRLDVTACQGLGAGLDWTSMTGRFPTREAAVHWNHVDEAPPGGGRRLR